MMSNQNKNYDSEFPPLQEYTDEHQRYVPKVPRPTDRDAQGRQLVNSQPEAMFNWQSENAIAQNKVLQRIEKKVTRLTAHFDSNLSSIQKNISDIQTRINNLYNQINSSLLTYRVNTQKIAEKETKIRSLNTQLAELKQLKTSHDGFPTMNTYPVNLPLSKKTYPQLISNHSQHRLIQDPHSNLVNLNHFHSLSLTPLLTSKKPQPMFPMPPQGTTSTQINDSSERWIMKLREDRLQRMQKERKRKGQKPVHEQPPPPHSPKPQPGITINPTHTKQTYAAAASSSNPTPPTNQMMISPQEPSQNLISTFLQISARENLPMISLKPNFPENSFGSSEFSSDNDLTDNEFSFPDFMTIPHVYKPPDEPHEQKPDIHMEDTFTGGRHSYSNNFKSFTIDDIPPEQ
ncbi:hypothetical protein CCACVL1_17421 [Corchorus capsularis]|uniref:Uncharacterized protein n=1 Tax=Corchorus capsularis TaxID=210143 RepID=A0A1R3HSA0_COCAP|nr:hypothetical protein CCACVL1_17421 [Corchorus capsularis]